MNNLILKKYFSVSKIILYLLPQNFFMEPYQLWQLEKYGNVINSIPEQPELQNSEDDRFTEWVMLHAELQLVESEF